MASSRCAPGSPRFTKCCSARPQGPRFGSFAALFGTAQTAQMIRQALAGEFLK